MATKRLEGRNGEIWRQYCRGRLQEDLAVEFELSRSRVSEIVNEVARGIPPDERDRWRIQSIEVLREVHLMVVGRLCEPSPPAFHAGEILHDEHGEIVRDSGPFWTALSGLVRLQERMGRALGTDAPTQIESLGELKVTVEGVDLDALT